MFRKQMDLQHDKNVNLFKVDILKFFGCLVHKMWQVYFYNNINWCFTLLTSFYKSFLCTGIKSNEIYLVPELQKCGIWNDLITAIHLVAYHSNSLIHHMNNKCVECYNSIATIYIYIYVQYSK